MWLSQIHPRISMAMEILTHRMICFEFIFYLCYQWELSISSLIKYVVHKVPFRHSGIKLGNNNR